MWRFAEGFPAFLSGEGWGGGGAISFLSVCRALGDRAVRSVRVQHVRGSKSSGRRDEGPKFRA